MVSKIKITTCAVLGAIALGLTFSGAYYYERLVERKNSQEPTRKEFKQDTLEFEGELILDIDGDGRADLITDRGVSPWIRFYKPGYDIRKTSYTLNPNYSCPMSSNLEEVATAMSKNYNEYRYQKAKCRYDYRKK